MLLNLTSRKIFFVHGIFGWGPDELPISYWGEALEQFDRDLFERHEVKCGPVSSFHDRACELYAQIKGGDFVYSQGSNTAQKRARVRRSERRVPAALHPDWSERAPIILVAHSAGAQTCLKLQHLLAQRFWDESNNADWIEAIVCVAGVLNGSTLTYMFGCNPVRGTLDGVPQQLIGSVVGLANTISDGGPLPQPWLEQWFSLNDFVTGQDNLAYDLTLRGCFEANQSFSLNSNTYYLSLVTGQRPEFSEILGAVPFPLNAAEFPEMNPLLRIAGAYQAARLEFDSGDAPISNWGSTPDLTIGAWRENDGAVSRISQRFPFTHNAEASGEEGIFTRTHIEKGRWYFQHAETIVGKFFDHLDPVFGPKLNKRENLPAHRLLYQKLNTAFSDCRAD